MIFSVLIIHNHDRMSSITRDPSLHNNTWVYFTSHLPDNFCRSPKLVKEAIMTDVNILVQELWGTSCDDDDGTFFAMCRLHEILQACWDNLNVCFYFRLCNSLNWLIKSTEACRRQILRLFCPVGPNQTKI